MSGRTGGFLYLDSRNYSFLLICAWRLIPAKTTAPKQITILPRKNNITIIEYVKNTTRFFSFYMGLFDIRVTFQLPGFMGSAIFTGCFSISRTAGITVMLLPLELYWRPFGVFFRIVTLRRRPILLLGTIGFLATIIAFVLIRNYPGSFVFSIIYFFMASSEPFFINLTCVKSICRWRLPALLWEF